MAKFLKTTGVSFRLEELIKNTKEKLILISPYLQFSPKVKDNLHYLNLHKKDIRIIYRKNNLGVEDSNWLENQIGIRTSLCKSLHAKCYLNESEAIVTSMNLYQYSQENNDEMGIHVNKNDDMELYNEIIEEAERLLTISEEIRISVKKIDKKDVEKSEKTFSKIIKNKTHSSSKLLTTNDISYITGHSSRKINNWLTDNQLMYKKDGDWITTKKGKDVGGVEKNGQWGKFVIWPDSIVKHIK